MAEIKRAQKRSRSALSRELLAYATALRELRRITDSLPYNVPELIEEIVAKHEKR